MARCRCPRRRSCVLYLVLAQLSTLMIWILSRRAGILPSPPGLLELCSGSQPCVAALRKESLPPIPPFYMNVSADRIQGYCRGQIQIHDSRFAVLSDVVLDPIRITAKARGGEGIEGIMSQLEEDEFYTIQKGFLSYTNCSDPPEGGILPLAGDPPHVKALSNSVQFVRPTNDTISASLMVNSSLVVTLTRYEFANVYWTVIDLYDTFMLACYMKTYLRDTHLLMLDAHPLGHLDDLFHGVFKSVIRPPQFKAPSRVHTLITGLPRQFSPMLEKSTIPLPMLDSFRQQVFQSFSLTPVTEELRRKRCLNDSLSVLFIWRRNYVAHPRNPGGKVARKILNEDELLVATARAFPKQTVRGIQLDKHTIREQLGFLAEADIFVGMHGAAFGYVPLLSPGSGVLEMWPQYWGNNWHMEYLAKKSGHFYKSWKNSHKGNEDKPAWLTKVEPAEITAILSKLTKTICSPLMPTQR